MNFKVTELSTKTFSCGCEFVSSKGLYKSSTPCMTHKDQFRDLLNDAILSFVILLEQEK